MLAANALTTNGGSSPPTVKASTKKTHRLLQLSSLSCLVIGTLGVIPGMPGGSWYFLATIATGVCGVLGLSLMWHRMLQIYTGCAWLTTGFCVLNIALLATGPAPGAQLAGWAFWICCSAVAVPAAVLSSTMHLLRVWHEPLVTEQTAPLVEAEPPPSLPVLGGGLSSRTAHAAPPQRPVWPPPDTPASALSGSDVSGAAHVASAFHSGDASGLRAQDAVGAARVGAAASRAWPPS
jgi:hypothetical protein|eukprot:Transcript_23355.p2 GENE.Transcript_23355~~Transcript_23355.p2  ORF type:complete len:236 (-),score=43.58 Transcript_23355:34-741(-)